MPDNYSNNNGNCSNSINYTDHENPCVKMFKSKYTYNAEKHKTNSGENDDIACDVQLFPSFRPPKIKPGGKKSAYKSQKDINNGKVQ